LKDEVTAFGLDVIGRIPAELNGRFLKMGPNPVADPDPVSHHWFKGNGMAHGLRLREGKAEWFRSRFVVDRDVAVARGREPIGGPGQERATAT
jgi:carotenoid cleavage dioxygenase